MKTIPLSFNVIFHNQPVRFDVDIDAETNQIIRASMDFTEILPEYHNLSQQVQNAINDFNLRTLTKQNGPMYKIIADFYKALTPQSKKLYLQDLKQLLGPKAFVHYCFASDEDINSAAKKPFPTAKDAVLRLAAVLKIKGTWREPDNYYWAGVADDKSTPPWNPLEHTNTAVDMVLRLKSPFPAAETCKDDKEFCRRCVELALKTLDKRERLSRKWEY